MMVHAMSIFMMYELYRMMSYTSCMMMYEHDDI